MDRNKTSFQHPQNIFYTSIECDLIDKIPRYRVSEARFRSRCPKIIESDRLKPRVIKASDNRDRTVTLLRDSSSPGRTRQDTASEAFEQASAIDMRLDWTRQAFHSTFYRENVPAVSGPT